MLGGLDQSAQAAQWPPLPGTACHHRTLVPLFNQNAPRAELDPAATSSTQGRVAVGGP